MNKENNELLIACMHNRYTIVKFLLENNNDININYKNKKGETPLLIACENGYNELAKLLIGHGADVNISCNYGSCPLESAINKDENTIIYMSEKINIK